MNFNRTTFCGMIGANTPNKLDPLILHSQDSCDRFFASRLSSAIRAGADHAILHMIQGQAPGNDYAAPVASKVPEFTRNHFTNNRYDLEFSIYTGLLLDPTDPTSLVVGRENDEANKVNWADPQWSRFAQQEWKALPFSPVGIFIDLAGEPRVCPPQQQEALARVVKGCRAFMGVEPCGVGSQPYPSIHTLKFARQFRMTGGVHQHKPGASPGLVVIEADDQPPLRELADLHDRGWTLCPAWSLPQTELQICFRINEEK